MRELCAHGLDNTIDWYGHLTQYIILKDGKLRFNSFNITSKQGVHSLGNGQIANGINEKIINIMIVKIIYCPY